MINQQKNSSLSYCFCELALLFALDLLTDDERQWMDRQVLDYPDLAEELAQYQLGVTAIPYGVTLAPFSPAVKIRLSVDLGLLTDQTAGNSRSHSLSLIIKTQQR
jgi:hypothetical protein